MNSSSDFQIYVFLCYPFNSHRQNEMDNTPADIHKPSVAIYPNSSKIAYHTVHFTLPVVSCWNFTS